MRFALHYQSMTNGRNKLREDVLEFGVACEISKALFERIEIKMKNEKLDETQHGDAI